MNKTGKRRVGRDQETDEKIMLQIFFKVVLDHNRYKKETKENAAKFESDK